MNLQKMQMEISPNFTLRNVSLMQNLISVLDITENFSFLFKKRLHKIIFRNRSVCQM